MSVKNASLITMKGTPIWARASAPRRDANKANSPARAEAQGRFMVTMNLVTPISRIDLSHVSSLTRVSLTKLEFYSILASSKDLPLQLVSKFSPRQTLSLLTF